MACLDSVGAVDTHEHLLPPEKLCNMVQTTWGPGVNLYSLLRNSYLSWTHSLPAWKSPMRFEQWWVATDKVLANARATSFYRYHLPAFKDLYGVNFESLTPKEAAGLDKRIFQNYKKDHWVQHVITERANIDLMCIDPNWNYGELIQYYPFAVKVFRVQHLIQRGFHPSEFEENAAKAKKAINPYAYAMKRNLPLKTFDDYLNLIENQVQEARRLGAVCMKQAMAYHRSLYFENVPKEKAARAFGRRRCELSDEQIRDFEDYIVWHLVKLSGQYDLPFQIHTGSGRIPDTNPMLLMNLLEAFPNTKFILLHGGYPWISEIPAMYMRAKNLWGDLSWLPNISYSMAKRALHEWLDVIPSNRIMWGGDCVHVEGIYGTVKITRRCIAEVLAERITKGQLSESQACRIGKQILRDNALELFPRLAKRASVS